MALMIIRCHRTQARETPILDAPPERHRLFLGVEHFQQAAGGEQHDILKDYLTRKTRNRDRRTRTNDQRD